MRPQIPPTIILIAIIHEPLFQISTQPTLRLGRCTAPSFQRLPSRRIHMHPDHDLALFVVYTDIVILLIGHSAPSPGRREDEAHYCVCDAVAERRGMCGDGVQREIVRIALMVVPEEWDDQE